MHWQIHHFQLWILAKLQTWFRSFDLGLACFTATRDNSYPYDEFFNLHLTTITDSYNPLLELCLKQKRFETYVFVFSMKNMNFVSRDQLLKNNIRIIHECEVRIKKIRPRVTVWHYEAVPSDAKQWSRGKDFSIRTEQPW